ncbi:hypothetical protein Hanom_Chr06g00578491 [Helianthus anomalus]
MHYATLLFFLFCPAYKHHQMRNIITSNMFHKGLKTRGSNFFFFFFFFMNVVILMNFG